VLRGLAVGLVMLCHAWTITFGGAGIVGVTTFFALSGYLITGLLIRDVDRHGGLRPRRFYTHRVFRLYPALIALLAGYCVVSLAMGTVSVVRLAESVVIGLLYLADLPSHFFAPATGLAHLWTLAVEEQFYLVWPWVLLLGLRRQRVGLALSVSFAAVIAASIAVPLLLPIGTHPIYQSPTSWAVTLLMGAAARIYRQRIAERLRRRWLCWGSLVLLLVLCFVPSADKHVWLFLVLGPVVAAAAIVMIFTLEQMPTVCGGLRPLLGLGTISYAAYLWNYPITVWLPPENNTDMPLGWGLISIMLTVLAAVISWYTVEAAGRALRARYQATERDRPSGGQPHRPRLRWRGSGSDGPRPPRFAR